jgi:hypothetical protein
MWKPEEFDFLCGDFFKYSKYFFMNVDAIQK